MSETDANKQAAAPSSEKEPTAGQATDVTAKPEQPDSGEDSVEEELEIARRHADPSKGDKVVDGGDRVSTEEGGNPQE